MAGLMNLFTPNYIQLLSSCYPPSSALLTAGPDYAPKSQELSRLTYFASNHPAKLTKLGVELDKRLKAEARKARSGNLRSRASLLISLSIFRSLATECRRDISFLSPSLMSSVDATLKAVPSDLEVVARAASIFLAWSTYTDGHLIGADSTMTNDYLSALRGFAALSSSGVKDSERRNRNRLIGFAAISGALTSDALYNDSLQFRAQVAILLRPILVNIFQTSYDLLDQLAINVSKSPTSPYLAEFRSRPVVERRAASIHIHVDGDKGPSDAEVSEAALRALYSLLQHSNGAQLGYIIKSSFDNLDDMRSWSKSQYCSWFAKFMSEWSQYQYRFLVPTSTVEHLLQVSESPTDEKPITLLSMVSHVLNSPTPLINLSTSDIVSNLMSVLLRKVALDPHDVIRAPLVDCIASLGTHVYYSDQIQDLAGELINRLVLIELQGVPGTSSEVSRAEAIRCIIAGLLGLLECAQKRDKLQVSATDSPSDSKTPAQMVKRDATEKLSSRAKVTPDIWQDTLSLLCDTQQSVRADYARSLVKYVTNEYPVDLRAKTSGGAAGPSSDDVIITPIPEASLLQGSDVSIRFLNSVHAYLFILATSPKLGIQSTPSSSPAHPPTSQLSVADGPEVNVQPATPVEQEANATTESSEHTYASQSSGHGRRSFAQVPRARKNSNVRKLLVHATPNLSLESAATLTDYAYILEILTTLHNQFPVRGLLTGAPMLLALEATCTAAATNAIPGSVSRLFIVRLIIQKVWLLIAERWSCDQLATKVQEYLSGAPSSVQIPIVPIDDVGYKTEGWTPMPFPIPADIQDLALWEGISCREALAILADSPSIQNATGLTPSALLQRLSMEWSTEIALSNAVNRSTHLDTVRTDGISPLLKISPALMHVDNISMASLTRSTRGVGVTDLREALEGRNSLSNPMLTRPASVSTVDRGGSFAGDLRLGVRPSQNPKRANPPGTGEVKDVLTKLGIGKQNPSGRLKPSFPQSQGKPKSNTDTDLSRSRSIL